jgi:hypothetical protein
MMVGTGGTSRTGKIHHYYKCGNAIYKKSCDRKAVKKDWLERHVAQLIREYVLQDKMINRLADAILVLQKQENKTLPLLHKQLGDVVKRINNVLNSIEEGLANASVKLRLDELETKKEDIEIAIAKESIEQPMLTKDQIVFWISRFKDGDIDNLEYRKHLVDIFVNSIFLYDDEVVITYNWKDGTKKVTLAKLEAADTEAGLGGRLTDKSGSYLDDCAPHHPIRTPYAQLLQKPAQLLQFHADAKIIWYTPQKQYAINKKYRRIKHATLHNGLYHGEEHRNHRARNRRSDNHETLGE